MPLQAITASEPIPGYRIRERIGAGGYGEVWRADAPGGLGKAIKFVYGYLDEDRAARELKALNRIKSVRHPFLVSLERIEIVDGQLLIVTELAEASLKERFDEHRKNGLEGIPRDELLKFMRDAADALDYMSQEHSLQHLDVKPENLLMLAGRVKVADFGLVKNIHDATASVMGGLTPLYAPPEVFDGRPSNRSDQYSLAIVYQEMLTGELPFPGTTAIQLAQQHLNARPRISSLPERDRPAIARALSKNPADRFQSCGELVDALCLLRPAAEAARSPSEGRVSGESLSGPKQAYSGECDLGTNELNDTGEESNTLTVFPLPRVVPAPVTKENPPIAIENPTLTLRPTLFLGAGYTAGRVLAQLKRRMEEQFGDLSQLHIFQTLLLDTDGKELLEVTSDQRGEVLSSHETIALPLRRPRDYRDDSRQLLKWLSRRWLYNIPRSLKTEGLRPLGRLALIDHASIVMKRIRLALEVAVDNRSATQAAESTGHAVDPNRPRVVVVSSISGGTGGGMVNDLGYLAKHLLASLGFADEEVRGILLHSTSRDASRNELEMVNAYSTLLELNHLSRWGGTYPGELAFEIPPKTGNNRAFDDTYLVHMGEELSEHEFTVEIGKVADYLALDAATTAGCLLDACRDAEKEQEGHRNTEIQLRTFGVHRVSCLEDEVVDAAVEYLCGNAVDRWSLGQQIPEGRTPAVASANDSDVHGESNDHDACGHYRPAVARVADSIKFGVESLTDELFAFLEESLETTVDSFFRERLLELVVTDRTDSAIVTSILNTKKFLDSWLGIDARADQPNAFACIPSRQVELSSLLTDFRLQATEARVEVIRSHVFGEIETVSRIRGAQQLAKAFGEHCQAVAQLAQQMQLSVVQESEEVIGQLEGLENSRGRSRSRRSTHHLHTALMQYCRRRLLGCVTENVLKIINNIKSQISVLENELLDLNRDVRHIAGRFSSTSGNKSITAAIVGRNVGSEDGLRISIAKEVSNRFSELTVNFEEQLEQNLVRPAGGLRNLFLMGGASLHQLPGQLRSAARATVMNLMKQIDTTSILAKDGSSKSASADSLTQDAKATMPRLANCGGAHRLLVALPTGSSDHELLDQLNQKLESQLSTIEHDGGDVTLCHEIEQLSLTQVAVSLIDHRRDLAESATRLHSRTDVQWSHLPDVVD